MPNSISVSGSLLHMMKLCENLKSAIGSWSVVILNAVIGDPFTVLRCINIDCIAVFKLLSMFWYVVYLTREVAPPESIRALYHFPTCTVIVGQSVMSAIFTFLFEDGPPCSWGSLLREGSTSLKTLIPLLSQWNYHRNCRSLMEVLLSEPFYSY